MERRYPGTHAQNERWIVCSCGVTVMLNKPRALRFFAHSKYCTLCWCELYLLWLPVIEVYIKLCCLLLNKIPVIFGPFTSEGKRPYCNSRSKKKKANDMPQRNYLLCICWKAIPLILMCKGRWILSMLMNGQVTAYCWPYKSLHATIKR
jgi:hypothetical protein